MTVSPLRVGERAPDFTLPSTSGSDVTLSALRGSANVLLAFFPLAFTEVCTAEMCGFSADVDAFRRANTKIFGISVDSVPTLKEFKAKHGISVDLLSDFKREVSRRYGILLEDLFVSQRAYVVIDRDGVVRWTHVEEELGQRRDNAELLAELDRLG